MSVTHEHNAAMVNLENLEIKESSGVCLSRLTPGAAWTHNDKGNAPALFKFDLATGKHLGRWPLPIKPVDLEDCASIVIDGRALILLADTGDNDLIRKESAVYVVDEATMLCTRIAFKWPGGKARNCEAMGITANGLIYFVTKTYTGKAEVMTLKTFLADPSAPNTGLVAELVRTITIQTVTAMDISPDGMRAAVLANGNKVHEFVSEFKGLPTSTVNTPKMTNAEAVCYADDGRSLWLTSEGTPCPLHFIKRT